MGFWFVCVPIILGGLIIWIASKRFPKEEKRDYLEELRDALEDGLSDDLVWELCLDLADSDQEKANTAIDLVKRARPKLGEEIRQELYNANILCSQFAAASQITYE